MCLCENKRGVMSLEWLIGNGRSLNGLLFAEWWHIR